MKKLQYLIVHCSASPEGVEKTAKEIWMMHTDPAPIVGGGFRYMGRDYKTASELPAEVQSNKRRGRGWKQYGYTDMIHLNGIVENLVPHNDDEWVDPREITNGAVGINSVSRHVMYVGGVTSDGKFPMDTRTAAQKLALTNYIRHVISRHADIQVAGHNQFAVKACPSFDVPKWCRAIGIAEKNI